MKKNDNNNDGNDEDKAQQSNRQKAAAMKLDRGSAASPWKQMDFLGWKRCVSHLG